jgi:hypothetical protein
MITPVAPCPITFSVTLVPSRYNKADSVDDKDDNPSQNKRGDEKVVRVLELLLRSVNVEADSGFLTYATSIEDCIFLRDEEGRDQRPLSMWFGS